MKMDNKLYRIETITNSNLPKTETCGSLITNEGFCWIKLHPVKFVAKPKNEVVHGKWENITDFGCGNCFGYCSVCRTPQKAYNAAGLKLNHRYCSWCGAKMDGDSE